MVYLVYNSRWTIHHPSQNIHVGDLVILSEESVISTKWPLARVIKVHPGKDSLVRVATVKTNTGVYTLPVTKSALLLPSESEHKLTSHYPFLKTIQSWLVVCWTHSSLICVYFNVASCLSCTSLVFIIKSNKKHLKCDKM